MRASTLELFPRFYDERQTASAAVHIAHLDMTLIEDCTYFVHETDGDVVACGDWTRRGLGRAILESCERAARAEGSRTLALWATLPGEPLYRAFGFREVERTEVTMADGVSVEAVAVQRPIRQR